MAIGVLGSVGAFVLLAAVTFILSYLYKSAIMSVAKQYAGNETGGSSLSSAIIQQYSHIQKAEEKTWTGLASVAIKTLVLFAITPLLDITYLPRRCFRKWIWAPLRGQNVQDSLALQARRELMLTVSANHFLFVLRSRRVIPRLRPLLLPGTSWMLTGLFSVKSENEQRFPSTNAVRSSAVNKDEGEEF